MDNFFSSPLFRWTTSNLVISTITAVVVAGYASNEALGGWFAMGVVAVFGFGLALLLDRHDRIIRWSGLLGASNFLFMLWLFKLRFL